MSLFPLVPLLAAPILGILPVPDAEFALYLERYLLLVLFWLAWSGFSNLSLKTFPPKIEETTPVRRAGPIVLLGLLAIAVLVCMTLFRARITQPMFLLLLGLMVVDGARLAAARRGWEDAEILFLLLSHSVTAFFTVLITLMRWHWEAALAAISIGAVVTAVSAARRVSSYADRPFKSKTAKTKRALTLRQTLRRYSVLACFGPVGFLVLTCLNALPQPYLLTLIVLPLSQPFLGLLRTAEQSLVLPPRFLEQCTGISALFVVILVFLSGL